MPDNNNKSDNISKKPNQKLDFNFDHPKIPTREIPRFTDLRKMEIPPKQQLIAPWLTEKSISLISGWRGTGKTWFALSIIDAVAHGKPFGPWQTGKPVPCLYLDGELPIEDVKERLYYIGAGVNNQNSPYIYSNDYETSKGYPKASLYNKDWCNEMRNILISLGIKLWVIDNLASLAGGLDENTKKDWDPINSWLLDLRFSGISTIMLQNTSKSGVQRGTSAREDNLDISIILDRPSDYKRTDGCRFITKFTKNRVRTEDLGLIEDTEFNLIRNASGIYEWEYNKPTCKNSSTKKCGIIKAISDGTIKKDIAHEFKVTPTYVSKIGKSAIKDGYLNSDYSLTKKGVEYLETEV